MKHYSYLDRKFVSFLEIQKAAQLFQEITDEDAGDVRTFLEGLLSKPEETLERFMSHKLRLSTKKSFDPDERRSAEGKSITAALAMFNSGNAEDFKLHPREEISTTKIKGLSRSTTPRGDIRLRTMADVSSQRRMDLQSSSSIRLTLGTRL